MSRNLSLEIKKKAYKFCQFADVRAMRQGREHCKSKFSAFNGHCNNFESKKPKKT